ncbi:MAG: undecaprenyl/decaprenyl-phosphate alpha-N-acetylglucosaminyl 1-phosphate transferase [Candidatus Levybacteria bacterium]|nr:undecaprenyl/decaprenyl-phosphate alpha-N-acetylglucosaminyl 1-phosphate transferase [Candidatus Levybacteria bacterium]
MNDILTTASVPFFISLLITILITPLCIVLLKKYKIVDDPAQRKHPGVIHISPIPRGGGIPLLLGVIISMVLLLPFTYLTIALMLSAMIALIVGVVDDVYNAKAKDLHPYIRFAFNGICAVIVVAAGVSISFITNPLGGIIHFDAIQLPSFLPNVTISLAHIITLIWIVWVMNMLNWSKGVDGQMPGIVGISAIIIGILSLRALSVDPKVLIETKLSFMIAGSAFGFLIYNFYPAKIFPGYGATSLYLLLAVVSILSSAKLATALLVMGVPAVDGLFTIARRLFTGRSPFLHDKKHLHHLLLALGVGQRGVAIAYWGFSVILGILALTLDSRSKLFALLLLIISLFGSLLFLHFIVRYTHEKNAS